jgi:biotin carboxylase
MTRKMARNVLMISPGYPAEMALFTRGLATAGADVIGLGDQATDALPQTARSALSHYVQVGQLAADDQVQATVRELARRIRIDQVECLWEPYMLLAARLREQLGLPGLTVAQTLPFRDKERMKQLVDAAGLRTPWHKEAHTVADVWAAAERIGYPLIIKPVDGAGSADTYRADEAAELDAILPGLRHVPRVSVEEFIEAEEFTYDTICANGEVLVENICQYHPRPLVTKIHEWVSPITMALRDLDDPLLLGGRNLGRAVLKALGFEDGFTHMEWYRKADGEVVFGEIGARPPGARTVDVMNYATDADLFTAWAQAVTHGRISQPIERRYNAASIFKRASGAGRITHYEGLDRLLAEYGPHVAAIDLLPPGAPRRDWRATLIADGMVIVRHPELPTALMMARRFAADLRLYAS